MKLSGFCYANGVHWCDTSVYNDGYFKCLAIVKNSGLINWKVKKENLPDEIVKRIENDSKNTKERFMESWRSLPQIVKYQRIIDVFTISELVEFFKTRLSAEETIKKYEQLYFERC